MANTNEPLREATADVFTEWIDGATRYFAAAGITQARSRELAFAVLCLLEGAFIFSRAMRSTESLHVAGRHRGRGGASRTARIHTARASATRSCSASYLR